MARTRKAAAGAAATVQTHNAEGGEVPLRPAPQLVVVGEGEGGAQGQGGVVIDIPLTRLKKSPRNARKSPHTLEDIQALAGSIAAKRILHFPTVEPELDMDGVETGDYLVTIGEGRRLAMVLLAQRGTVARDVPVRCILDTVSDALEISLDENVTRSDMHPADQFEAFREVAETRGWGADEIAARFGVSPTVVRQRLRLGAVSPKLIALYREEGVSLEQLMAFAVSEDHARQEQVWDSLTWNKSAQTIRRAMVEAKVHADDKRAIFIGAEAYLEAGGSLLRDLFTEDGGGWFEDVALLDRLTAEKLAAAGDAVKVEGWKWVETHMDFPHTHGLPRLYPRPVQRTEAEIDAHNAMAEEYDSLTETWAEVEDLPAEVEARLAEIDAALEVYGDGTAYAAEDIARTGAFVVLGYDGLIRVEQGFLRPEDARALEAEDTPDEDGEALTEDDGEGEGDEEPVEPEDDEPDGLTPLPDRLVADLTAHRTLALREALAGAPDVALLAVVHAMVVKTFYPLADPVTCLDLRLSSAGLVRHAEGIGDTPLARASGERHAAWAKELPSGPADLWDFIVALDIDSRMSLLAYCAGQTVDAVQAWERRPMALAQAGALATMVGLDLRASWTPTVRSYLGRVTKARILEAVREGVSAEAVKRLAGLKKADMAEAAEAALAGSGWLPPLLRTQPAVGVDAAAEGEAPLPPVPMAAE